MDFGSGVSSAYTSYISSQAASKLDSRIKSKDYTKSTDEELLDVCKQFESYFVEQIYKAMQKPLMYLKMERRIPMIRWWISLRTVHYRI